MKAVLNAEGLTLMAQTAAEGKLLHAITAKKDLPWSMMGGMLRGRTFRPYLTIRRHKRCACGSGGWVVGRLCCSPAPLRRQK